METLKIPPQTLQVRHSMNRLCVRFGFAPALRFASPKSLRASSSSSFYCSCVDETQLGNGNGGKKGRSSKVRSNKISDSELKQNWLSSLSSPLLPLPLVHNGVTGVYGGSHTEWVIGIDPDVSGALALLSPSSSAQVFDTPHLQVLVGKRVRKRLDARAIVQILTTFQAPPGTTAFIEQSIPFPQDGKQGWWCGGFGYGLWIGILVASGFSVVPVPSSVWKNHFELCGSRSLKDESRIAACSLFPSMASLLKRKKDHGRAEALLIAAYGKSLRTKSET